MSIFFHINQISESTKVEFPVTSNEIGHPIQNNS